MGWYTLWLCYDMSILQITKGAIATSAALGYLMALFIIAGDRVSGKAAALVGILVTSTIYGPMHESTLLMAGAVLAPHVLVPVTAFLSSWGLSWLEMISITTFWGYLVLPIGVDRMAIALWIVSGGVVFFSSLRYTQQGIGWLKQLRDGKPS